MFLKVDQGHPRITLFSYFLSDVFVVIGSTAKSSWHQDVLPSPWP